MAHPGTSGTAYTVLATLVQLMGENEAFDYLKQLQKMFSSIRRQVRLPAGWRA